ncbi:hypothetical protein [Streptomyces candidus]|uniref:Uncharacterized protein n=1 Tax=Streptomyces candidus TaxID=67283 RepID=A0A7X0LSS2_9ACTN|nr:hypothetical protein [Streptomyces candidus]MBB6439560.1 hypothetical protein [Streptomyces candidus]GHH54570.1 hypothetical protein GCM10018773_57730 [Streptomyces candidus]
MTTASLNLRGALTLGGVAVRCPGRENAPAPRRLNLLVSGTAVMASCGEKHPGRDGGRKVKCFFAVEVITPAMVKTITEKFDPNKRFRVTLPGGKVLEGRRGPAAKAAPAGTASSAFAAKKAAARGGKQPAARRGGGGGLVAALNTVTAVAGTATAAVNAVGATAGAVGKGFDMGREVGREGMKAGHAAIKAADNASARRFARDNRSSDGDGE